MSSWLHYTRAKSKSRKARPLSSIVLECGSLFLELKTSDGKIITKLLTDLTKDQLKYYQSAVLFDIDEGNNITRYFIVS